VSQSVPAIFPLMIGANAQTVTARRRRSWKPMITPMTHRCHIPHKIRCLNREV
jgi:hypothetical protein